MLAFASASSSDSETIESRLEALENEGKVTRLITKRLADELDNLNELLSKYIRFKER